MIEPKHRIGATVTVPPSKEKYVVIGRTRTSLGGGKTYSYKLVEVKHFVGIYLYEYSLQEETMP